MIRPLLVLAIGVVLGCIATGHVLSRIDRARAEAEAARAEVRLLQTQIAHRDLKASDSGSDNRHLTAELVITNKRLEVLRATMAKLISAGVHWPQFVALPELATVHWPAWPERGWDLKCEPMRVAGGGAVP